MSQPPARTSHEPERVSFRCRQVGRFSAAVNSQCVNADARSNIGYQWVLKGALLGYICAPCKWWCWPRRLEVVPSAEHRVLAVVLAAWLFDVCFEPRRDATSAVRTGGL
jgi:hypothetical protein